MEIDDDVAPSRTYVARLRKKELERSKAINCGYCGYHKGENKTHYSRNSDPNKLHKKWKR